MHRRSDTRAKRARTPPTPRPARYRRSTRLQPSNLPPRLISCTRTHAHTHTAARQPGLVVVVYRGRVSGTHTSSPGIAHMHAPPSHLPLAVAQGRLCLLGSRRSPLQSSTSQPVARYRTSYVAVMLLTRRSHIAHMHPPPQATYPLQLHEGDFVYSVVAAVHCKVLPRNPLHDAELRMSQLCS